MKICICPDSFKGTLTSVQVCENVQLGILRQTSIINDNEIPKIIFDNCPMSDGGKGFLASSVAALNNNNNNNSETFELIEVETVDPYFDKQTYSKKNIAKFGFQERKSTTLSEDQNEIVCVVETAEACGIHYLPPSGKEEDRNPLDATSFGVGELFRAVFSKIKERVTSRQVKYSSIKILVGLGGSATNDCGVGCLQALGCSFFLEKNDDSSSSVPHSDILKAKDLINIKRVDLSNTIGYFQQVQKSLSDLNLPKIEIILVSDVTNPLLGKQGATAIYGPQKGARSKERQELLEAGLAHAHRVLTSNDSAFVASSFADLAGAGAAGGLGGALIFALKSFGVQVLPGAQTFAEIIQLERRIGDPETKFVISGEGSFDSQTIQYGKTVAFVASICKKFNKPLIVVCGMCDEAAAADARTRVPPVVVFDTVSKFGKELSMSDPGKCLEALCFDEVSKHIFSVMMMTKHNCSKM